MDHYQRLGVPRDAGEADIREAHRKLTRKYHPDVSTEANAAEMFKEVQSAYEILSSPHQRRDYDIALVVREAAGQPQTTLDMVLSQWGVGGHSAPQPAPYQEPKRKKKKKKRRGMSSGSGRPDIDMIPDGYGDDEFNDLMEGRI